MPRVLVTAVQSFQYEGTPRQAGERFEMFAVDASMAKRKGLVSLTVPVATKHLQADDAGPQPSEPAPSGEPVDAPRRRRYRTREMKAEA